MTRYSSYRPKVEQVTAESKQVGENVNVFVPIIFVGTALAAVLMVLLLLTQSQLSRISFEISSLEQELETLETQYEKLLISHAEAYRPNRMEELAVNELGMVRPNTDQIRYIHIDTVENNRKEPE